MDENYKIFVQVIAMIGLAGIAAYLNINRLSAAWLWIGVVILFISISANGKIK